MHGALYYIFVFPVESNIRYVVLGISNVGRGEAEPNITDPEHNISNVGRHRENKYFVVTTLKTYLEGIDSPLYTHVL